MTNLLTIEFGKTIPFACAIDTDSKNHLIQTMIIFSISSYSQPCLKLGQELSEIRLKKAVQN